MCANPWDASWDTPQDIPWHIRLELGDLLILICFCFGVVLEPTVSSMFRPKCYRQNDRTDLGIISCVPSNSDFDLVFTSQMSLVCEHSLSIVIVQ